MQAFFAKHASMLDQLVCRNDLSCRIIKKRKQAYCNLCRLKKCLAAGMMQDGSCSGKATELTVPFTADKVNSGKKKTVKKMSNKCDTLLASEHYEQAAATLQALIPDMVSQGLTSCLQDDDTATCIPQIDCVSQIPKSLIVGGTLNDTHTAIALTHGLLKDSDISISFDDEPEMEKKA